MDRALIAALRTLLAYSPHFDPWSLAGPSRAGMRQDILSALLCRRVTRADSGVNSLASALYVATGAQGNCGSARQADFVVRATAILNGMQVDDARTLRAAS